MSDPVQLIYDAAIAIKPETRKPGEFLSRVNPYWREQLVKAINRNVEPAPWVLKILCDDQSVRGQLKRLTARGR